MIFQGKIALAMTESFEKKCEEVKKIFAPLTADERYQRLMQMGRSLPPFPDELKTPANLVAGCQSMLFLHSDLRDGKMFFQAHSDALISSGLAALLIFVYSGESPKIVLLHPPAFLSGLSLSLTPARSNGLSHIHLRMRQLALSHEMQKDSLRTS